MRAASFIFGWLRVSNPESIDSSVLKEPESALAKSERSLLFFRIFVIIFFLNYDPVKEKGQ